MAVQPLTLKQSMSKNVQAIMPIEEEKQLFEKYLVEYLTNLRIKFDESEEHQKGLLSKFLNEAVFKNENSINTNERADLAVFNGGSVDSSVGIIIEMKSTTNKGEMINTEDFNRKSFQEILSYYLRERIVNENIEIKKCIITNGLSWFVIDSNELEKHFIKNKKLLNEYNLWRTGKTSGASTEFLYENICKPAIDLALEKGIKIAHFDLTDAFKKKKSKAIELKKSNLTQLYRFFTPENLLKKEIFVDPNKLNRNFYDELLYLMGLEEVKLNGRKVIRRLQEGQRQQGSFVENTINRLTIKDVPEEEAYEAAIQLSVIWINRILFLKLLESQLTLFNNDESYKFLTKDLVSTFEDVWDLFFGVLAKRPNSRPNNLKEKYKKVPYLNSSLFEEYELERTYIGIDRLREEPIQVFSKTVLKGDNQKRKTGNLNFLTYLFEFLNAYDFSTAIRHQKDVKNNLINASVLGLIFEKINGYKEGSYYTPGKVTMYMARKAIRKTVVDKFNKLNDWKVRTLDDIKFHIRDLQDAKNANTIINSLRICDPAVGSGHFLVSVLNELIAIKSELGVLLDHEGKSMNRIRCTVVNDELIVQDMNGDNFTYKSDNVESYHIQKSLFNEKRRIIENCLFGVDINSNSVNICRLRLWIELLKNSYYEQVEGAEEELITLPNIDINIKTGNSLLYNIPLETDTDDKRGKFLKFDEYYQLVNEYKNSNDKVLKKEISDKIANIKSTLRTSFETPERKEVTKRRRRLNKLSQLSFFEEKEEARKRKSDIKKAEKELKQAKKHLEESVKNPMWSDAIEWRLEFPEILDTDGKYIGFDLIIANPPYIYSSNNAFSKDEKRYFEDKYKLNKYQANTFGLFLELAFQLLRTGGHVSVIIPNSFLTVDQYKEMREFLLSKTGDLFILNSRDRIFEDASIDNCIISSTLKDPTQVTLAELEYGEVNIIDDVLPSELYGKNVINIASIKNKESNDLGHSILEKIQKESLPLEPNYGVLKVGLKAYKRGKGSPKQPVDKEEFKEWMKTKPYESTKPLDETYLPYLGGRDVGRYFITPYHQYIKYGENLAEPRSISIFSGGRLLIREISGQLPYAINSTFLRETAVNNQSAKTVVNLTINGYFLIGVLNSKVESFWAAMKFDMLQRKTFPRFTTAQMREFPIPNCTTEKQTKLANLVQQQLSLHQNVESEDVLEERTKLDDRIDELVMDLFQLSDEEKVVVRHFSGN
ncbi:Eco57I restriction-modification methylase domain-containing protein [Virgibacillus sp. NKC19-16]|uniref:type IIG restriction enzyme/methyltransferase n=1 Tax=Virgibacillus salidurans TaxID=2831673 RepID=UPI001F41FAA3|nr:TaqI-like C-terminal specificity domain-containing protein [Virgibacillus sp. NKC19-16]UJL46345.1 Eco57I restriction-modification methylase domain-containing protein [Virgibacillus sp. NKC19-16]